MGTWNTRILGNDIACDVRNAYRDHIIDGRSNEEASLLALSMNSLPSNPDPEDVDIILGLAVAQAEIGRLDQRVQDLAIHCINSGMALAAWIDAGGQPDKRKKVLNDLATQLLAVDCKSQKPKNHALRSE